MTWPNGTKVVCVDDDGDSTLRVRRGQVYTVRCSGKPSIYPPHMWAPTVYLNEVRRPTITAVDKAYYGDEVPLAACRFRPVTDISDLIAITKEVFDKKPRTIGTDEYDNRRRVRV